MAKIELTDNQVKLLINGIDYMIESIKNRISKMEDAGLIVDIAKRDLAELLFINRKLKEGGDIYG